MNKYRVSFDLSIKGDESTSRIIDWLVRAVNMSLERGEAMTNLVVEQEDESYDNGLREVSCDEDCC